MAVRGDHVSIIEDLINAGSPANRKVLPAIGGYPPPLAAAERACLDAVKLLLK